MSRKGRMDWEEELETIYRKVLPPPSRAREADNQGRAHLFFKDLSSGYWPFLALCAEVNTDKLTWHHACDEHRLDGFLDGNYNGSISEQRRRPLKVIELYYRPKKQYYILEQ